VWSRNSHGPSQQAGTTTDYAPKSNAEQQSNNIDRHDNNTPPLHAANNHVADTLQTRSIPFSRHQPTNPQTKPTQVFKVSERM